MLVTLHIKFKYQQYPFNLRVNTPLSKQQQQSREKSAMQKTFDQKLINTLMRCGKKLKINNVLNKWWVHQYRIVFRYIIFKYQQLTSEEILKKFMDKVQFIEFIQKNYVAWTLSDLLIFRLSTLISMFQLKQYKQKNTTIWYVTYLIPKKRLNYMYSMFILNLRASKLNYRDLKKNFNYTFLDFFEKNDTEQELFDLKIQAYEQFLF